MAKRTGGGKRGGDGKGNGPKPTQPDKILGPRRLSKEERAAAETAQRAELEGEFERRRKMTIAKAALELSNMDAAILTLVLNHPGMTQEAIGEVVGLTRQTVNEHMNAPKFKRAIEAASRSALEIFEGNKARAARRLGELIGSVDDRVAIRAAIAHMWPEIHREDKGTGADFVSFVQEAFELAEAAKAAADAPAAPASSEPADVPATKPA